MRIAAKSASPSVMRTLEAIILQSGHSLSKSDDAVDFLIIDTLNPTAAIAGDCAKLLLVEAAAIHEGAVACPLRPERLLQRLSMLGTTQSVALGNGWTLDMLTRSMHHAEGATGTLTEKECSLLNHLAQSHPVPMGRDTLLEQVWGVHGDIDTHTLETHIYRLRAKLNELTPNPCDIITQGGAYALVFGPNPS
jgi:hypothetical protein